MQTSKIFLLITIQIFIFISAAAQPLWESTETLYGGDIRNVAVSPNGTLFAGLQDGSLYKKRKIDSPWEKIFQGNNEYANYGFPGLLIFNDSLIFCSSMDRGTLKSTDGGKSWTNLGLGYGSLKKNRSNLIFHLGWWSCDDLSVSTNFGDTWRTMYLDCDAGWYGDVDFANNDSIWIIGSDMGMLFSADSGYTWEFRNSGLPENNNGVTSLFVNSSDDIFAGTRKGVYFSTNYGSNWLSRNLGMPANCHIKDLYAFNDSVIYAGSNSGIYFTTNAGETWNSYNTDASYLSIYKIVPYEDSFLAATKESLLRVDSNSVTFFDTGISDIKVKQFYEYSDKIYTATNRGIFYSENDGAEWIAPDGLRKLYTSALTSSDNYIFSAYSNVLIYSEDGITNWNTNILPTTCYALAATNNNTLFAGIFEYGPDGDPPIYSDLYVSTDFGSTWLRKPINGLAYAFIKFLNKDSHNNIYFLGYTYWDLVNYIYRSIDGGEEFINFTQGLPTYYDFTFNNITSDLDYNHYLSTSQGIYFRSETDSAWSFRGLSGKDVLGFAVDSSGILYAATTSGIYLSSDQGLTYSTFNEGLPQVKALSVFYSHKNNTLFLGTDKGVFKRTPPDITSVEDERIESTGQYNLSSYPNPFNAVTIIKFSLPERAYVKMSLFNSLGEKVIEVLNQEFEAGDQSVSLNAKALSTGVYFCRMDAGKFNKTIKLILVK